MTDMKILRWFSNNVIRWGDRDISVPLFWGGCLAIFWLGFYYIGGMLSGFAQNSISLSLLLPALISILLVELVRGIFCAATLELDSGAFWARGGIILLFTLLPLWGTEWTALTAASDWMDLLIGTLFPALALSVFLTELSVVGGIFPGLLYRCVTCLVPMLMPVTPSAHRLTDVFTGVVLPLVFFIVLDNDRKPEKKGAREITPAQKKKSLLQRGLVIVAGALMAGIVCLFLGFLPWRMTAIATGSMEPVLQVGDMVIVARADTDPQEGDIIQFTRDGVSVIHRVESVIEEDGEIVYITRGDANNASDSGYVTQEDIIGTVVGKIPYIGWITLWLHGG